MVALAEAVLAMAAACVIAATAYAYLRTFRRSFSRLRHRMDAATKALRGSQHELKLVQNAAAAKLSEHEMENSLALFTSYVLNASNKAKRKVVQQIIKPVAVNLNR